MWHWWLPLQHWLAIHTGTLNEPGPFYGFWSGFGSDLSEFAIVAGLVTVVRRHNCEVHHCWRLGRHQTAAQHNVCRRHHPDDHLTAEQVHAAHQESRERLVRPGTRKGRARDPQE